jgi:hypothetical protein
MRTTTLMPMLRHLLLGFLRLHPPLPVTAMTHLMGCKMVVVAVQMEPALRRLPHLRGYLQGACAKEFKKNGFALLHHKFFCKGE